MLDHNIIGYARISQKKDMQAFIDANYISDLIDQKSICRYLLMMSGRIVYLNSIKKIYCWFYNRN